MTATEILENISYIMAKKQLNDLKGAEDPEIDNIVAKYNICKQSLTDRQKNSIRIIL